MRNAAGCEEGAVARPAGVGDRADFCSCEICIHPAPKFHNSLSMVNYLRYTHIWTPRLLQAKFSKIDVK
ncbi:hypothetical protein, partial [Methylotuvimicrobium sp.]|uniref:hypothetical protein n=1 Tax=Methylotuvimicrobium sp. TaxID=2822413 RepID=UPI003D655B39